MEKKKVSIGTLLKENYLIIGCVIFFLTGMFMSEGYLSSKNISSLLCFSSIYGLIALSEAILILVGEINIAIGAQLAVTPIMGAALAEKVLAARGITVIAGGTKLMNGWGLTVLFTILFSVGLSILTWFIRVTFNISTFIITLGLNYVFTGLCTLIKPYDIVLKTDAAKFPGKTAFLNGVLPLSFILFLVIAVILAFMMAKTRLGKRIYAIGNGEKAAIYCGITTKKIRFFTFFLSGLILALAALVNCSRLGSIAASNGDNKMFYAIVISILGGVNLGNNRGTIGRVAVGAFMMYLLMNVMTMFGFASYTQNVIVGALPIVAIAIQNSHNKALSVKNVR